MMDAKTLFLTADRALSDVISQIKEGQWEIVMPADFKTRGSEDDVTLKTVINYHAYDEVWVPDMLAGKTIGEVGAIYDGDLLGDDPAARYDAIVKVTTAAVEDFFNLDKIIHLSYGDFPARDYFQHISIFRGMRSYDIARVIGVDTTMPDDLVKGLWEMLEDHAEEWRAMGVFGPKVDVPEDAPLQDRLLGLTGRQPR